VSTTVDYLRSARMLLNKCALDCRQILSRKTMDMMTNDQLGVEVQARSTHPLLAPGYRWAQLYRTYTPGYASLGVMTRD
jgi:hypothetical protein